MRTALICHDGAPLNNEVMARWLTSFSDLVGIVVIREEPGRKWKRVRREIGRVGWPRFIDVLAMRAYYRAFLARTDRAWTEATLGRFRKLYPVLSPSTRVLVTTSPNSVASEEFLRACAPDIGVARCKVMLRQGVFSIPSRGMYVFHAGICPEYRNAHGCFWALANNDLGRVGMTLLRIDPGVDTGPVFGHFSYPFDEVRESYMVIQHRVVLENLDALRTSLLDIYEGRARQVDTSGRASGTWGQPWLTRYFSWRRAARQRAAP